jgi:hypothetical protein
MNGPDYSHSGEMIAWPDDAEMDERFSAVINLARAAIGTDFELFRWDPEDPVVAEIERMWVQQRAAIRRYVGPLEGMRVTTTVRMHKELGLKLAYVRFNRKRLAVAPVAAVTA